MKKRRKKIATCLVCFCFCGSLLANIPLALASGNETYTEENSFSAKIDYQKQSIYAGRLQKDACIKVLDSNGNEVSKRIVDSDISVFLDEPNIPKDQIFTHWEVKTEGIDKIVSPFFVAAKDVDLFFVASEGGSFISKEEKQERMTIKYKQGTNLQKVFPEVKPKKKYKFDGFYVDNVKLTEEYITKNHGKLSFNVEAKFFPDKNDNDIDDRTEKISVEFETNTTSTIPSVQIDLGATINAPIPESTNGVFMGWYLDKRFQEPFNDKESINDSIILYAKWLNIDFLMKNQEIITEQSISEKIEKILENTNNYSSDGIIIDSPDLANNESASTNNQKYVFVNSNANKSYIYKFYDENKAFLFSVVAPYGKILKLYDENNSFKAEYSVRQNTTIILNTHEYVSATSILSGFTSSEFKKNSTTITELRPQVTKTDHLPSVDAEPNNNNNNKKIVALASVLVTTIVVIVLLIFFFKKNKVEKVIKTEVIQSEDDEAAIELPFTEEVVETDNLIESKEPILKSFARKVGDIKNKILFILSKITKRNGEDE